MQKPRRIEVIWLQLKTIKLCQNPNEISGLADIV